MSSLTWMRYEVRREPGRVAFWAVVCVLAYATVLGWLG
jgi:hypothetical protein